MRTQKEARYAFLRDIFINMRVLRIGNATPDLIKMVGEILHNYLITLLHNPSDPYLDEMEHRIDELWLETYGSNFPR